MPDWTDTLAIRESGSERGFGGVNTRLEDLAADEQPSIPGAAAVTPRASEPAQPAHTAETAKTAQRPATAKPSSSAKRTSPAKRTSSKKAGK